MTQSKLGKTLIVNMTDHYDSVVILTAEANMYNLTSETFLGILKALSQAQKEESALNNLFNDVDEEDDLPGIDAQKILN